MKKTLIIALLLLAACQQEGDMLGDVHKHADFKVYLDGEALNFSKERYMTSKENPVSVFVHLHDMDGEIIHTHIAGVTVGEFFRSIDYSYNGTCFTTPSNETTCGVELYVNGETEAPDYIIEDLDRILLTNNYSEEQMESVTDRACIQSGKCPERGTPYNESSCLTAAGCVAVN